jgi:hypothetical protein
MPLIDPDNMGYSFAKIFAVEFLVLGLIIFLILKL